MQQMQGQVLEGHTGLGGPTRAQQSGHAGGVTDVAAWMGVLEHLEVIVHCVAHHHFPLQQLQDLGLGTGRCRLQTLRPKAQGTSFVPQTPDFCLLRFVCFVPHSVVLSGYS